MALEAKVLQEGYSYVESVDVMTRETIERSKHLFSKQKEKGALAATSYDSNVWVMTDEVRKNVSLSFALDEVAFQCKTAKVINTTLSQYKTAMRIVITSRFGYSIATLQGDVAAMKQFANKLEYPKDYDRCQLLVDLLCLLPHENYERLKIIEQLNDIEGNNRVSAKKQRTLAYYQSYFRFDHYLSLFWELASKQEKLLYFPVYFWWNITAILPLRPTECVLTPRRCIRQEKGRYMLTVRRTSLKGYRQMSKYKIADDYERKEYPLSSELGKEIETYISGTDRVYQSDIDVLFCKETQFALLGVSKLNDCHYTYENLSQCLQRFYNQVLCGKYGLEIVSEQEQLGDYEIQKIKLGDTRHVAMVTLAVSGATPTICKELAGHDSIEISSHYFSNVKTFLDVLSYERFRANPMPISKQHELFCDKSVPVKDGYCQYVHIKTGDFKPCRNAVDSSGNIGVCSVCEYFLPCGNYVYTMKSTAEESLKETCVLLKQAVEDLHSGIGNTDTLSCVIDQLKAKAERYSQTALLAQRITESEVLYA